MERRVAIVGAGVVGLAVAAELGARTRGVTILERRKSFGEEASGHNSGVVHAGLYDPPGSLKARLAVEGKQALFALCRREGIPHRRNGKLVVAATEEEERLLDLLAERGKQNGVDDLQRLTLAEARKLEPAIGGRGALFSPGSGVVDVRRYLEHLAGRAASLGVEILCGAEVSKVFKEPSGYRLYCRNTGLSIECPVVINAAGLGADRLLELAGVDPDASGLRLHACKGEYFSLAPEKAARISRLIYPIRPLGGAGLGVHATPDLLGRVLIGPTAVFLPPRAPGSGTHLYDDSVDPTHRDAAAEEMRTILPFVEPGSLSPALAGIRPKLSGPEEPWCDFVVEHETHRGLPGWIDLLGIESPGLTASLALARRVREIAEHDGLL